MAPIQGCHSASTPSPYNQSAATTKGIENTINQHKIPTNRIIHGDSVNPMNPKAVQIEKKSDQACEETHVASKRPRQKCGECKCYFGSGPGEHPKFQCRKLSEERKQEIVENKRHRKQTTEEYIEQLVVRNHIAATNLMHNRFPIPFQKEVHQE